MKEREEFYRCECCDELLNYETTDEDYEEARVHIDMGHVLLSKKTVERNRVEGVTDSHIADISGHYCDLTCLYNHVIKLTGKDFP